MQDRLIKTHHRILYYYFKKATTAFGIFIGASILVAIPISIAASLRANAERKEAEDAKKTPNDGEQDAALLTF
jgi:hypothetical protein